MCAIATPFVAGGALDLDAFGRLIDYQIDGGTEVLVVAGSTGEAHFLTHDEFTRLVEFAVGRVAGRVPVVVGTGEAGTTKTVAMTRHAASLGADAALVVAPYYVRPTQEGLRRHYLTVADEGGLPVVAYNVPSRTACDMQPATVAALRTHPGIVAIKEAVSDVARIHALAELVGPDFVYLSGDDYSAGEAMLAGAGGTVSVVANLVPRHFRALCDVARAGDARAMHAHRRALSPLLQALTCAPNPIPLKAGLAMLGFGDGSLRQPLVELAKGAERDRLQAILAALLPDAITA
ncbi:MAG TPA: 4-hydroxy-tetrahydrodipicolinate synthase [Rhodanobacteraceae bacterium]